MLQAIDAVSLIAGWWLAYETVLIISVTRPADRLPLSLLGLVGVVSSLVMIASKRLWLARVCAVRSAELESLGATAVVSALIVLAAGQLTDYDGHDRFALLGAFYSFLLLSVSRGRYSAWLRRARRRGHFARSLVLVGTNRQAAQLASLVRKHPEIGYQVVGACGPRDSELCDDDDHGIPWLGEYSDVRTAISDADATGALVVASALEHRDLNYTIRALLSIGCHVHVSSAMSGIALERLLPLPLAREPLFYLERRTLTRSQLTIKRITDLVISSLLLIVALPVISACALIIRLSDGGPAFFRQRRVGYGGATFTLYKLRTMSPDADGRLSDVAGSNERVDGPLFKAAGDPRVTRVGRWLRATSLDELPQLFNVLQGNMSLVGPRPALPREVAEFDDELMQRGRVMPGLTGLWQVEGRDDPSFDTYRRLDLYYVENWSIGLDLAIIGTTAGSVVRRSVRLLRSRNGAT